MPSFTVEKINCSNYGVYNNRGAIGTLSFNAEIKLKCQSSHHFDETYNKGTDFEVTENNTILIGKDTYKIIELNEYDTELFIPKK